MKYTEHRWWWIDSDKVGRSTERKPCSNSTFCNINPTRTALGTPPGLSGRSPYILTYELMEYSSMKCESLYVKGTQILAGLLIFKKTLALMT